MNLIRDVLDNQLVDRNGEKMGRVDGVIAELRPGAPPRLVAIEVGAAPLARRIGRRFGAWIEKIERRCSPERPARIPWTAVAKIDLDLTLTIDAMKSPAMALELWLRRNVIEKIPGG